MFGVQVCAKAETRGFSMPFVVKVTLGYRLICSSFYFRANQVELFEKKTV